MDGELNLLVDFADLGGFKISERFEEGTRILRLWANCGHSALGVRDVEVSNEDSHISVIVYISEDLSFTKGYFDVEIEIPDHIDEVRFGRAGFVVWDRKNSQ